MQPAVISVNVDDRTVCHWSQEKVTLWPPGVQTAETAPMNHQEGKHKGRPCQVRIGCTIWQWCACGPFPSAAHRTGPVKTVISQTKLMWTSGAGFAYSPTRMSSPWLPVRLGKKGSRGKKRAVLPLSSPALPLLLPLKSIHRWQKSPEWPYQLFYYFSRGGRWQRWWQEHILSSEIRWESLPPLGEFLSSVIMQNLGRCVWLRRTWARGPFDRATWVTFTSRSFLEHTPVPSFFFFIQSLLAL